ncbi:MAG TPA: hypothetical protein VF434_14040, partial [Promineifilum sp.]
MSKELAREEELTKPHKSFETRRRILRARVLLALIRAPRGLTAEQLHYALDSSDDDSPESWRPDQDKLREYVEVLKQIESEFLGKRRSSWEEFAHLFKDAGPAESSTYRVGLQDEIYRIFAEHRGLAADPPTPTVEPIRELLMGYRGDVFRRRLGEEREERRRFYRKLGRWADWRHKKLLAAKRRLLELDEKEFETDLRLTVPASYNFRELNGLEVRDRSALNWAITLFEIERMVYELLDNPEWSLNTSYITLEDDNDKAAREEEDFLAQAEMWRTLNDDFLMKFVPLTQRKIVTERRDKPIDVLRRVAEQESIARWIKRFALRGEYKRAIKFSEDIEEWINDPVRFPELSWECVKRKKADSGNGGQGQLSPAPPIKYVWDSWRHTVATGERLVWKNVAVIRQGRADEAIAAIEGVLEELRERYHRQRDYVFEIGDRIEYGFKAVEDAAEADPNRFDHPGRARLKRLFSHIENTLGYAYSRKGEYQRAVEHYAGGLFYIQNERDLTRPDEAVVAARDEKILMPAHRAKLLNNAARAHSEIWNPSTEMCLDGLAIRREVAEEIPIAGSLNT